MDELLNEYDVHALWWLRSVHSPQPIRIGQAELDPLHMRRDSTRP